MPLTDLLAHNRAWATDKVAQDPDFFKKHSVEQHPKFLWIGCSDSRVASTSEMGFEVGDAFVHRNVANLVNSNDTSCLAVVQFAVEVLKVEHIIVSGHYGCGGIHAATERRDHGTLEQWLSPIRALYRVNYEELQDLGNEPRENRLVELNVEQQVVNLSHLPTVQHAWERGQPLQIHGCVYALKSGLLKELEVTRRGLDDVHPAYRLG